MIASASAPSIEVSTCEPWSLVGVACQPSSRELEAAADQVGAAGRLRVVLVEDRGRPRRSRRVAPSIAPDRRPGEEQERDHRRDRVARAARRPAPARRARRPNQVGLPGRSATPQKTCSTPSAASAGRTWSCSPTETPPETTVSSPVERPRERRRGRVAVVGDDLGADELRAGALDQRRRPSTRSSCGSPPGRSGSPGSCSSSPVVSTVTRGAPRAGDLAAADRGEHPELGRARARSPAASTVLAGARCPRPRGGCRAGLDLGPGPRPRSAPPSVSSTRTTASAPSGTIAPVEIAIASPASSAARRRVAGARLVDHREPAGAAVAPAVSAARTA